MRAKLLLVASLALPLGACGGKSTKGPAPLNKHLLTGKWKNSSEIQIIAGYEFAEDGTLKMNVRGMGRPVPGRFTWVGDRDLTVKYEGADEARKAYRAAAKAYKDEVQERVRKGELPGVVAPSVRDELPAEETFRVGIAEPAHFLVLTAPGGNVQRFEKAD